VIAVSEQTAKISAAWRGEMEMGISINRLRELLDELFTVMGG
jgi:hypothetical protein